MKTERLVDIDVAIENLKYSFSKKLSWTQGEITQEDILDFLEEQTDPKMTLAELAYGIYEKCRKLKI